MASRGRGRGAAKAPSGIAKPPKTPGSVQELNKYLKSLNEGNLGTYGEMFADMVHDYVASNDRKLQEAVNLIFDATVESKENTVLGAKVCEKIIMTTDKHENAAAAFRHSMLMRIQTEHKRKQEIRAQSIEAWLGIFSFLCELFLRIKIQDQPVPVVGKAILSTTLWMLELSDCDDDEVDCICEELKRIGYLLESISADHVRRVFKVLRKKVITCKSTGRVRCLILELLEYRAMGWKDPNGELDEFYIDALPDAVAEDETSQCS